MEAPIVFIGIALVLKFWQLNSHLRPSVIKLEGDHILSMSMGDKGRIIQQDGISNKYPFLVLIDNISK